MTVEADASVLPPPAKSLRTGWAEASQALAAAGDDELLMPEFANGMDEELTW